MRVAVNHEPARAQPRTIVGIGLNYLPHAADLSAKPTELPTIFFKGGHTVIGPGDVIGLPPMSQRVTAEAELGLVIGRRMYQVTAADALGYVAGGCCVLDQTAEDARRRGRVPDNRPAAAHQHRRVDQGDRHVRP